jgi:hypothetical protein
MVIVEGGPTVPTTEPVPPQKGANVKGPGIVSPAGRVSVNATPVSPTMFGLVMVNVRIVVPPAGTVAAPNAFENVGGVSCWALAFASPNKPSPNANLAAFAATEPPRIVLLKFVNIESPRTI